MTTAAINNILAPVAPPASSGPKGAEAAAETPFANVLSREIADRGTGGESAPVEEAPRNESHAPVAGKGRKKATDAAQANDEKEAVDEADAAEGDEAAQAADPAANILAMVATYAQMNGQVPAEGADAAQEDPALAATTGGRGRRANAALAGAMQKTDAADEAKDAATVEASAADAALAPAADAKTANAAADAREIKGNKVPGATADAAAEAAAKAAAGKAIANAQGAGKEAAQPEAKDAAARPAIPGLTQARAERSNAGAQADMASALANAAAQSRASAAVQAAQAAAAQAQAAAAPTAVVAEAPADPANAAALAAAQAVQAKDAAETPATIQDTKANADTLPAAPVSDAAAQPVAPTQTQAAVQQTAPAAPAMSDLPSTRQAIKSESPASEVQAADATSRSTATDRIEQTLARGASQASAAEARNERSDTTDSAFNAAMKPAEAKAGAGKPEAAATRLQENTAPKAPSFVAPAAMAQPPAALQAAMAVNAAANPAASDRLTPRVGTPDWDAALGQKVVWMVAGGEQSASLTLNPPDLGPMQVVLNVSNAQADASFFAAQPETREALESALPKLRDMLGEAGIQLGQATVSSGTPDQRAMAGDAQSQAQAQASRAAASQRRSEADSSASPPPAARPRPNAGSLLVDTFA